MKTRTRTLLALVVALGFLSTVVAQQDRQQMRDRVHMSGDCVFTTNQTTNESMMVCRYEVEDQQTQMDLMERMRQMMQRMMGQQGGMQGQ